MATKDLRHPSALPRPHTKNQNLSSSETVTGLPDIVKTFTLDPEIPFLGICPVRMKVRNNA